MQGWCGKLSYERKLKLRVQTQLPTTMRTNFSIKTINTYIYLFLICWSTYSCLSGRQFDRNSWNFALWYRQAWHGASFKRSRTKTRSWSPMDQGSAFAFFTKLVFKVKMTLIGVSEFSFILFGCLINCARLKAQQNSDNVGKLGSWGFIELQFKSLRIFYFFLLFWERVEVSVLLRSSSKQFRVVSGGQ